MDKKQVVVVLIALAAVAGVVALCLTPSVAPPSTETPKEFSEVDDMFSELDDFLGFENQDFDTDLGDLGTWD